MSDPAATRKATIADLLAIPQGDRHHEVIERIHAEPFAEVELPVGVLFGDDEDA